jgi:hypothetical protein
MLHSVLLPDTVTNGVFFDMEANFGFGRLWRRFQQGAELLEDFPQRYIVNQQRFVYLGQASENGSIGGDLLAHFDEGADDIGAHGDGAGAVFDHGGGSASEPSFFTTLRPVVVALPRESAFWVARLAPARSNFCAGGHSFRSRAIITTSWKALPLRANSRSSPPAPQRLRVEG